MTDEQEKRSALREEAASWFAAMQGPDAKRREGEFKTWLAADPSLLGGERRSVPVSGSLTTRPFDGSRA